MDNPSPYMIKLFREVRPTQLEENNGGLGYVVIIMQMILFNV